MEDFPTLFELLWPNDAFAAGGTVKLRVEITPEGSECREIWLPPNDLWSEVIISRGTILFRARLPSGTLRQQVVRLERPDPPDAPARKVVFAEASDPSSPSRSLHQTLGTLPVPPSPAPKRPRGGARGTRRKLTATALASKNDATMAPSQIEPFRPGRARGTPSLARRLHTLSYRVWVYDAEHNPAWRADPTGSTGTKSTTVEWLSDSALVHLADDRLLPGTPPAQQPHRLLELCTPGFLSRFTVLPPVANVQVLIRASRDPANAVLTGGMTMKVVPVDADPSAASAVQAILAYVKQGAMEEVAHLALSLTQRLRERLLPGVVPWLSAAANVVGGAVATATTATATALSGLASGGPIAEAIAAATTTTADATAPDTPVAGAAAAADKPADPFAAALGAYYLIRTGHFDKLDMMPRNFSAWVPTLPDTALLYAWQLMTDPKPYGFTSEERVEEIKRSLLEAVRRGIPLFQAGLRFLFERLRQLVDVLPPESPARRDLATAIQGLGNLLEASETGEQFTTFLGLSPWCPTRDPSLIPPEDGKRALRALPKFERPG